MLNNIITGKCFLDLILFCLGVCVCKGPHLVPQCACRVRAQLHKTFFLHLVGPQDQTQVSNFGIRTGFPLFMY